MSRQSGIIMLEIEENLKRAENALSSLESLNLKEKHFFYKFDCAYTDLNNHLKEIKRLREELLKEKNKRRNTRFAGNMKKKYDRFEIRQGWIEFLKSKGFLVFDETTAAEEDEVSVVFFGCMPQIRIELLSGNYREDTETGACICADFVSSWNKISQCPIYFCDTVAHDKFWQAIELMMNAGIEWSMHGGRIEEGNGFLFVNPTIDKNNKEKIYKIKGKKK